jgi:hypothetical protein
MTATAGDAVPAHYIGGWRQPLWADEGWFSGRGSYPQISKNVKDV